MLSSQAKTGYINIYELNESSVSEIDVLWFDEPTEE